MKTSSKGDYDPKHLVEAIDHERDLLNVVNIRREINDAIIRAAKRFKEPTVSIVEDRGWRTVIVIREGAPDA